MDVMRGVFNGKTSKVKNYLTWNGLARFFKSDPELQSQ